MSYFEDEGPYDPQEQRFDTSKRIKWFLPIDGPTLKEIRDTLQVNLTTLDGSGYEQLANDPITLVDVLYIICREQCERLQISDRDFGRRMAGETIDRATNALIEAIANFFPQSRRALIKAFAAKNRKVIDLAVKKLDDPQVEDALEKSLTAQMLKRLHLSNGVTSTPESSTFTQED